MSDERIITAATVTSGEKGDGPQLKELVEQSRKNGMEVNTVIGDTAYSGSENLRLAEDEEKGFTLVSKLHPAISHGLRKMKTSLIITRMQACLFVLPVIWQSEKQGRGKRMGNGINP